MPIKIKMADISITNLCNLKCKHCGAYVNNKINNTDLKKEIFYKIFNDLNKHECRFIIFSGGEPFVRKDFIDILQHLDILGIKYCILSNGTLITEEIVDKLTTLSNLAFVRISIDFFNFEVFSKWRGINLKDHDFYNVFGWLKAANIPYGVGMTILPENINDIHALLIKSKELGAFFFRGIPVIPIGRASKFKLDSEFYYECFKTMLIAKATHEKRVMRTLLLPEEIGDLYKEVIFCCGGAESEISIDSDGSVSTCPLLKSNPSFGNIVNLPLSEIIPKIRHWKNKTQEAILNDKIDPCWECSDKPECKAGCLTEILSRPGEKLQSMCLKLFWQRIFNEIVVTPDCRRAVNSILYDMQINSKNTLVRDCYRSFPLWKVTLRDNAIF